MGTWPVPIPLGEADWPSADDGGLTPAEGGPARGVAVGRREPALLNLNEGTNFGVQARARLSGPLMYSGHTHTHTSPRNQGTNLDTARVNLTLPRPVDHLVAELAAVTGQSKSSVIASYLVWQLPQLRAWLDAYRGERPSPSATGGSLPLSPMPERQVFQDDGPARFNTADKRSEELTRQQRRALERDALKAQKGTGNAATTHRHKGTSPKR